MLGAADRVITSSALERNAQDQNAAKAAFDRLIEQRQAFARSQSRLIAELPVFRAHLSEPLLARDGATIEALAQQYRASAASDFLLVADPHVNWLGLANWPDGTPPTWSLLTNGASQDTAGHSALVALADGLYLVVLEPAHFIEEVLGWLAVGYRLDDGFAKDLARITHADVNLIAAGRLRASSLDAAARARRGQPDRFRSPGVRRLAVAGRHALLRPRVSAGTGAAGARALAAAAEELAAHAGAAGPRAGAAAAHRSRRVRPCSRWYDRVLPACGPSAPRRRGGGPRDHAGRLDEKGARSRKLRGRGHGHRIQRDDLHPDGSERPACRRKGPSRGGRPRQGPAALQHEPRAAHAAQRHHRHDRAGDDHGTDRRAARVSGRGGRQRHGAACDGRRRAGLCHDRGRRRDASSRPYSICASRSRSAGTRCRRLRPPRAYR